MLYYGLSADRVKRVIRTPKRLEEGIAENTIGVMQPGSNKNKPTEVWVMYQQRTNNKQLTTNNKKKSEVVNSKLSVNNNFSKKIIISAWRYPGVSPIGKKIPIPEDILEELKKDGIISS
jgi:hypothetical protein